MHKHLRVFLLIVALGCSGTVVIATPKDKPDVKKAEKRAQHEQHELAEADQKSWHDFLKEQRKADKDWAKANKKERKDFEKYLKHRRTDN